MNKKISLGAAIALVVFVAAAAVFITMGVSSQLFANHSDVSPDRAAIMTKLGEIDAVVSNNYVGEINEEALSKGIMDGFFTGLGDPHSCYLTPEEYNETVLDRSGKSSDIGAYVTDYNGGMYVYFVMNNSPASDAGLEKGDIITAVAGAEVKDSGFDAAVSSIKSMSSTFDLTVTRGQETMTVNVTPGEFKTTTIEAKILELGNIGYIRIYNFVDSTDEQFSDAVETMLRQNVSGFIFDVRHNGGGTLSSVVNMIDKLCPAGPIMYKVDKDGTTTVLHKSDSNEIEKPMLVLMDDTTASAAELFACALRDYEKAELIGTKTYGKGSMQDLFAFKDGSAINLTTSLFNPPYSPNFNGVGILPDYEVPLSSGITNFFLVNEETDTQLQFAVQKMFEVTGYADSVNADPEDQLSQAGSSEASAENSASSQLSSASSQSSSASTQTASSEVGSESSANSRTGSSDAQTSSSAVSRQ
ncbi:MAG: PDZ domain-containing protein [Clostridia bacterium]|nr:PDZ domain-containing protein [Clostridia bacterium]